METLYPIFYGTRLVTFDVLRKTFEPHMHPEAARRGFNFVLSQGGHFGIGGGYRAPGVQPLGKPGFAPPGKSFHEGQLFPSGRFYVAWDMVVKNPGGLHRTPRWSEVPKQGTMWAQQLGWHMNVETESWHAQPIELDGYVSWMFNGCRDLVYNRPITVVEPTPPPVIQPESPIQPQTEGVIVDFKSRVMAEGARGSDVKFFQRQLNDLAGQQLTLDGVFGPKTTASIRLWQGFFKLEQNGNLDAPTQKSIIEMALLAS